ncbi:helicase C-terminal domain-containing protein [Mycena vulgaris]|nr:helicase C-terminal domain-containing protein [Mycena vulgaris]
MAEKIALSLPTPDEFPAFPYAPPYPIQVDLMRHLYASIEQKKVAIVESPTGTGKTLSLLCASLTWLADEKNRARKGILDALGTETDAGKDWVLAQTRDRRARELEAEEREYAQRLAQARKKEEAMQKMARSRVHKRTKLDDAAAAPVPDSGDSDPDDVFLPDSGSANEDDNISPAVRALMARLDKGSSKHSFFDQEEEPTCTKIYYASRTHSQLAQILPELRRLKLSPLSPAQPCGSSGDIPLKRAAPDDSEGDDEALMAYSRTVSLGSRKQLCINDEVRARSKDLDEGCRELIGETGEKRCQYLPPIGEDTRMLDFRDQILASPKDIEDLASVGRLAHTCPYFGSRRAIPQAELITLPYNLLLQKTAREALGIDLTDQIVIIDEAHNLIPTLLSLSTTRLPFSTLTTSFQQVCIYVSKFRAKLSAGNMLHLKRLVLFMDALKKYVAEWKEQNGKADKSKVEVMTVAQLLERLGRNISGVNLLEIEGYLKSSKIARKISGYSDKEAEKLDPKLRPRKGAVPPLHAVEAFLLSLTGTNDDGRLTFSLVCNNSGQEEVELKFQLLNPAPHFLEVIECARSVILAGGTMSPISDVINQLFSQLPEEKITSFSCGHIIPEANLQTIVVGKGPRGGELEYKAGKQGDETVIGELGQILLNFAALVPRGMIVFFPSYHFLNTAKAAWQKSGVLARFEGKKKVFFEPEQATQVDQVLQGYSAAVHETSESVKSKGGLLFAVIGAKLSEGLNFADDLARAVVIVGLPFANLGSPELRERMKYVKQLEEKRATKRPPGQKDAAAELYENMCMNAVNQSIGRAIRHRGDWASLILIDKRYASASIRNKLPKWIGGKLTVADGFGQAIRELGAFYKNKRIS